MKTLFLLLALAGSAHATTGNVDSTGIINVPAASVPIRGVTDGSNAAAGFVGEYISTTPTGAINAFPTSVRSSISTTTLTAGDWDVQGLCFLATAGALAATGADCCVSLIANSIDGNQECTAISSSYSAVDNLGLVTPTIRVSVSGNTAVYLTARMVYSNNGGSTWNTASTLRARRVR